MLAMGYPSEGITSYYRNSIDDVAKFLNEKHKNHFVIINLTPYDYDASKLNHQVLHFGFPNNHSPPLEHLFLVCKSMHAWLITDEKNVVVVHCMAGKGRTGTVISAYLLYSGMFTEVKDALHHFAKKRCSVMNGVAHANQKRFLMIEEC